MTPKQMCEAIAEFINREQPDTPVTAREIWEMSPTGEVWPVVALYLECISRGMRPVESP